MSGGEGHKGITADVREAEENPNLEKFKERLETQLHCLILEPNQSKTLTNTDHDIKKTQGLNESHYLSVSTYL